MGFSLADIFAKNVELFFFGDVELGVETFELSLMLLGTPFSRIGAWDFFTGLMSVNEGQIPN